MSWTDERIQELTRLWQAGHSASEIGKRLGVSKNSIVGKAHRLKLPSRPSPIKQQQRADAGGADAGTPPAGPGSQAGATGKAGGAGRASSASAKASVAQTSSAQPLSPQTASAQTSSAQTSSSQSADTSSPGAQTGHDAATGSQATTARAPKSRAASTEADKADRTAGACDASATGAGVTANDRAAAKPVAANGSGRPHVNGQGGAGTGIASDCRQTGARAATSAVDQPSRPSSPAGGDAAQAERAAAVRQSGGGQRSAGALDARRDGSGQGAGGATRLGSQRARVEQRGSASGCLWPIGDPGDADFHFCGADPVPGKPYCEEHAARAYITRSRSERGEEAA